MEPVAMTTMSRQCPKCGVAVSETAETFCEWCGADLSATCQEEPPTSVVAKPAPAPVPAPDPVPGIPPPVAGGEAHAGPVPAVKLSESASEMARPADKSAAAGELDVFYNISRIFVEGLEMPFQFRLLPRCDGLSGLCIEIRRRVVMTEDLVARDEPAWELSPGRELDNPIGFRPAEGAAGGNVTFEIYVGYEVDGTRKWFMVRKLHPVFERKAKVDSVIKQLNVQFTNEIKLGHASDAQVRQTLDGLDKLVQDKNELIEDFRGLDMPEIWVQLPLVKCHYKPVQHGFMTHRSPPAEALKNRLTLTTGSHRIHLLANSILQLGRNRENDICTRLFQGGVADTTASGAISRYHGRIQIQDNAALLQDKGWDPTEKKFKPSGYGIVVDQAAVPRGQSIELPVGREFTITLAKQAPVAGDRYILDGRLWSVDESGVPPRGCTQGAPARAGELSALVLRPRGVPEEVYVVLLRSFNLGRLDARLDKVWVCRCDEAFSASHEGRCEWLRPGHPVRLPGGVMQVGPYARKWVDEER